MTESQQGLGVPVSNKLSCQILVSKSTTNQSFRGGEQNEAAIPVASAERLWSVAIALGDCQLRADGWENTTDRLGWSERLASLTSY